MDLAAGWSAEGKCFFCLLHSSRPVNWCRAGVSENKKWTHFWKEGWFDWPRYDLARLPLVSILEILRETRWLFPGSSGYISDIGIEYFKNTYSLRAQNEADETGSPVRGSTCLRSHFRWISKITNNNAYFCFGSSKLVARHAENFSAHNGFTMALYCFKDLGFIIISDFLNRSVLYSVCLGVTCVLFYDSRGISLVCRFSLWPSWRMMGPFHARMLLPAVLWNTMRPIFNLFHKVRHFLDMANVGNCLVRNCLHDVILLRIYLYPSVRGLLASYGSTFGFTKPVYGSLLKSAEQVFGVWKLSSHNNEHHCERPRSIDRLSTNVTWERHDKSCWLSLDAPPQPHGEPLWVSRLQHHNEAIAIGTLNCPRIVRKCQGMKDTESKRTDAAEDNDYI